jgi:hypothetical protein
MKPFRFLKSGPPRSITTPGELPFQKGRPLPPSDDKDEGQVVRSAKRFAPNREVFTIHAGEDCEGLERAHLDDYGDYLLDLLDEDVDITMGIEFPDSIKIEDADDIQKERCKLINAKRAERKRRVVEMNQQRSGNLYDSSTGDLRTIINIGRDARNIIIARQHEREEVEAYSPTHYQIPLDYMETTWKCKQKLGNKPPLEKDSQFEGTIRENPPWVMPVAPKE